MSRYESKSEAFGQGILKDQRQRADKIAKEQESFSKKVASSTFHSPGAAKLAIWFFVSNGGKTFLTIITISHKI